MKNKLAVLLGATLLASNMSAYAGNREWATVGKVLTGVATIQVIDRIVNPPQTVVVYQQPVVVQSAPVVYQTAPVVYVPAPVYCGPQVVVYRSLGHTHHRGHFHRHR
jgi:hypothetical protein